MQDIIRKKMKIKAAPVAQYHLEFAGEELDVNALIGQKISLEFTGKMECLNCQAPKVFQDGYCFVCAQKLPQTDLCQVRPELCHHAEGTCRDESFAKSQCFMDHIVYLSLSSHVKVGITRIHNIPSRFLDQGAVEALPVLKVPSRLASGQAEVLLKKNFSDKTSWQKMLKGEIQQEDLLLMREKVLESGVDEYGEVLEPELLKFTYPLEVRPPKLKSLTAAKPAVHAGTLLGIKAQYLILDCGVINMRRIAGYEVRLEI